VIAGKSRGRWNVVHGRAKLNITGSGTMLIYTIAFIGLILILALGIRLMDRLVRRIWPLTPKQEEAEHFLQSARRSIDRFRHY